jgi:tol-pal system protein YbgF
MVLNHFSRSMMRTVFVALAMATAVVSGPALAQDVSELLVRLNRTENEMRRVSGQVEQLQFENRKLTDQLRKFQEDVDFRLNERGSARGPAPAANPATSPAPPQKRTRNDAFDPAQQPGGPTNLAGAPRTLGQISSSTGIIDDGPAPGTGPIDLGNGGRAPQGGLPQGALQRPDPAIRTGPSIAATGAASPKQDFDTAFALIQSKSYENAEMGFRQFLQSHPRDRLAPDATYWLGESYFLRARHREAAEQYLKVSSSWPKARRTPDSLLKLGMSLNALGARDQACATYAKLEIEHPEAPSTVKQGTEREKRRARCA